MYKEILEIMAIFSIIEIIIAIELGWLVKKFLFNDDKNFYKIFLLIAVIFIILNDIAMFLGFLPVKNFLF